MATSDAAAHGRRMIEINLAASLLMQIGTVPADIELRLPAYQPSDTVVERAKESTERVISVLGLDPDGEDGQMCQESLLTWFTENDAELQEDN